MIAPQSCLIIDDSDVVRRIMRAIIEDLGFDVEDTPSPAFALERCKLHLPTLIVLDWHIPGSNTIDLLAAIRSLPEGRAVKILYVPTDNDPAEIGRAIAAGANDYIIKPFYRVGLEVKVAALTTSRRGPSQDDDYYRSPPRAVLAAKR